MDFNLTEERRMLQDSLGRFLSDKYDHESRRKVIAAGKPYDAGLFAGLAELGVLGALFAEDQGGFGGLGFDLSVVFEELGRAGVIEPVLPAVLTGSLVAENADLVENIIAGEAVVTLAHSEAAARYDLNYVTTTSSNGVLNGAKVHVLNGAQASYLVVSAREGGDDWDKDGIALFLVRTDATGVTITDHVNNDGTSGATVVLDNVTPDARLTGGFAALELAVARGTLALSAEALGAMESAKALTLDYLKERKQFGIPIGKFQALQHRMADVLIEVEQARSAVINLAGHMEADRDTRERHVSATKNLMGRVGAQVVEEAVQMHGGIGMTDEYALSHFARRITMIDHWLGDVDHHLARFIDLSAGEA
ncbi:Acyl-CoA dehydrogenase [Shimia gijangensis]|uniref:Acyl-CoA dehydrogenase n=1 Tax=Shimia gijangensis TaxID=1470563 RepID=A0A1M6I879_9RHOB|nr:acyl-CoA dehydrogenase [Shimia gijangensis]SHJ30558.1 Acyl-CoA dehydrogenase [Shimia gijangensis]